jgi:hypothetical protein
MVQVAEYVHALSPCLLCAVSAHTAVPSLQVATMQLRNRARHMLHQQLLHFVFLMQSDSRPKRTRNA